VSARVKICGVTSVADATLAVQCGADLIGLNFYPLSPRHVSLLTALEIRAVIPEGVWCVGVFVNAERAAIASLVRQLALHAIQFHGDEGENDLRGWNCATIKAVRVHSAEPLLQWEQFPADYLLLDTYRLGRYGGTGEAFAWERAVALPPQYVSRLILAGGLTPQNVATAVRAVRPWAVDVASGVESAPGCKDPEKLRAFIRNAKTA
jgi:phosphoribosylanthranilate isomerase